MKGAENNIIDFIKEFVTFIENELKVSFIRRGERVFLFPETEIVLVPLSEYGSPHSEESSAEYPIYLYEDLWRRADLVIRLRLRAHLGLGHKVFARNTTLKEIDSAVAMDFLAMYHTYGYARAKYKYGLFYDGLLIGVALFSAPRPMNREGRILQSYEWVRYASLPDVRILGGMGKIMSHFIEQVQPDEIMSYADREWSDGSVYLKLGFKYVGDRLPVKMLLDPVTFTRISSKKIHTDRQYKGIDTSNFISFENMGSRKFLFLS